ncbi:MAG: CvpA family protein, partial [Oscillospiraceae bacterium]
VLTVICVLKFSTPVAEWIYNDFLRGQVVTKLGKTLQADYAYGTAQSQYNVFAQAISEVMKATSDMLGLDNSQSVLNFNPSGLSINEVSQTITDSYLSPIVIKLCKWVVSIFGFFILMAIFGSVGNLISRLIKATPLKNGDKLLGGVVGAVKATIMIIVFSVILNMSSDIIQSNNALKALQNENGTVKASSLANSIHKSWLVSTVNDRITF